MRIAEHYSIVQFLPHTHTTHFYIQYKRTGTYFSSFLIFFVSAFRRLICTGYIHIYIHYTRKPEFEIVLHKLNFTSLQRFVCLWSGTLYMLCGCAVCARESLVICVSRRAANASIECRRNKIAMCLHFQWKLNDKTSTWMSIFGQ